MIENEVFKNGFSSAVILLFTVRYKSKVGKNNSAWDIYMHEYMFFICILQ